MLVECGFVRAQTADGKEYTFAPSLGRMASLGSPREIVRLYVDLHGLKSAEVAAYVLACTCEQEDCVDAIGWHEDVDGKLVWRDGLMPSSEQIIIARHLMRHGIVGTAKPDAEAPKEAGAYSETFDAADYIAAAMVHFGLSSEDAERLSMTEFQRMLAMKFPDANKPKRDIPTREEYDAQMKRFEEMRGG